MGESERGGICVMYVLEGKGWLSKSEEDELGRE